MFVHLPLPVWVWVYICVCACIHLYVLECVMLLGSDCLGVMCVLVGACLCVGVITFLCLCAS